MPQELNLIDIDPNWHPHLQKAAQRVNRQLTEDHRSAIAMEKQARAYPEPPRRDDEESKRQKHREWVEDRAPEEKRGRGRTRTRTRSRGPEGMG